MPGWRPRLRPAVATALVLSFAAAGPGCQAARRPSGPGAAAAAADLQARYGAWTYRGTRPWQSANALAATVGYMRASGSRAYLADLNLTYRAHHGGDGFLNRYYDDEGWWALTWISAYDLTRDPRYLAQARAIFADMTTGWDRTCGGGLWWNKQRTYKNAIANELFLDVAARLHNRVRGDTGYLAWAEREWAWFRGTGMLTGTHLVVDGLAACKPLLRSPTWTYNQGVLIGGLVALGAARGSARPVATARRVADAVIARLSPHGVLRELCEPSGCDVDAAMFKGIFAQNLQLLADRSARPEYRAYLRANASAVLDRDRRGSEFGLSWSGPFDSSDTARQASALDVLNTQLPGGRAAMSAR